MQWHVYFKKCATEKDGINKVGLLKHDNMFQVINHWRKKLSSPPQDNKTITSPCVWKIISPQPAQHNVKGISKGGRTQNHHMCLLCILEMTEITEMSAAYFPPYAFASSGFFVQSRWHQSKHMANNPSGDALSNRDGWCVWCAFSLLDFYPLLCFGRGRERAENENAYLKVRGFKRQIQTNFIGISSCNPRSLS